MQIAGCYFLILLVYAIAHSGKTSDVNTNELNAPQTESEKKSRLVSFNNEHGEVKIELDFAVPFMKIPVQAKKLGVHGEMLEPLVEINGKGLVTVATMLFFLVTIVPKLVKLFIPQAQATVTDGLMPLMSRLDEALHLMNIPSKQCYQKSACWIGSSTMIKPSYISSFSPEWLKEALENPEIQDALRKGQNGEDCSIYQCPIPVQAMSKLVSLGKTVFNSDN